MNKSDNTDDFHEMKFGFSEDENSIMDRKQIKALTKETLRRATNDGNKQCHNHKDCSYYNLLDLYTTNELHAISELISAMCAIDVTLFNMTSMSSVDVLIHIDTILKVRETEFDSEIIG